MDLVVAPKMPTKSTVMNTFVYWWTVFEMVAQFVLGIFFLITWIGQYELEPLALILMTAGLALVALIGFVTSWFIVYASPRNPKFPHILFNCYQPHFLAILIAEAFGIIASSVWYVNYGTDFPVIIVGDATSIKTYTLYLNFFSFLLAIVILDLYSGFYISKYTELGSKIASFAGTKSSTVASKNVSSSALWGKN